MVFSVKYARKICLADQMKADFGRHRSGWKHYALRYLKRLHHPRGVLLDVFIERTFYWHPDGIRPHIEPWIGFIHVPPNIPKWFYYEQSNDLIFQSEAWQKSLPYCQGLFTLSHYHRKYLETRLDVPINTLIFPTATPRIKWSWGKFINNPEKKIVQVGWWLRKLHAIYQLPQTSYQKIFLLAAHPHIPALLQRERSILLQEGTFSDAMYATAKTLRFLSNRRYDHLLSENLVFVYLYDASANNTITECIVRNTPLLINPIPPVVEYLGETYPLYYHSFEEAVQKATDLNLIYQTHQYLTNHPMKQMLTGDYFLKSFIQSEIYQTL